MYRLNEWVEAEKVSVLYSKLAYSHELLPLAFCLFLIGFLGFLESREFLSILINTEIIMLGLNFYLVTLSLY